MESKKKNLDQLRKNFNLLIGALGSLAYAILAWGVDSYLLQSHNGSMPWLKMALGLPAVLLIFLIATWISARSNNLITRALTWMSAATILSFMISYLSFQGMEFAWKTIYPIHADQISYTLLETIRGRLFVIIVMSNILFFIGGMLVESASEAMIKSSGLIGWVLPILFCLAFFGGAGYVADANFNLQLRDQIISVNEQISEAAMVNSTQMTERQERLIRRFTKLDVPLDGPRRLFVGSFDGSFTQSVILIDFDGIWASCTSINGLVGNCERLIN